jgi:hypothetical protein
MPIVRLQLDVQSMKHTIVNALVDHHKEIQAHVENEIERLIQVGYLGEEITRSVQRHLGNAIDRAVGNAINSWAQNSPTVKQAIEAAVINALYSTEVNTNDD